MSEETTPKPTTMKTVSARVTLEIDLGFVPFMTVAKHYKGKNIPFGMRDASRAKFDVFLSAELGDDMTADELATRLTKQAHAIADRELRATYPESFKEAAKAELPDEAFIVGSTFIEHQTTEDF